VKVLNSKGIASHAGPESCVAHREVRDEALTGEPAGQPLSLEIFKLVQGADAVSVVEGNTDRRVKASACSTLRGLRTWHVGTLFAREPGDLLCHSGEQFVVPKRLWQKIDRPALTRSAPHWNSSRRARSIPALGRRSAKQSRLLALPGNCTRTYPGILQRFFCRSG
jgi:hypothetical protein